MLRSIGPFEIHQPMGEKLEEAKLFCNLVYMKEGNTSKHSAIFPSDFFTIMREGKLLGTMGIYHAGNLGGSRFPTEEAYDFDLSSIGVDPEKTGEIARLSGNGDDRIFLPFVAWVGEYMVETLGFQTVLLGEKPKIEEKQRMMGLPTQVQSHLTTPVLENIPKEFRPYFQTPPTPIVVTIDLLEALPVCKAHLSRLAE